jgi:ATP-dependent Clp protease ATP-binding subunit ClpX
MKYAVKYLKVRLSEDIDILIPKDLIQGDVADGEFFVTEKEVLTYITSPILDGKYIIGDAISIEDIRKEYNLDKEDYSDEDVLKYYFLLQSEKISIMKAGRRKSINIFDLFKTKEEKALYKCSVEENCLLLNKEIFDVLDDIEDLEVLKELLREYSDHLTTFDDYQEMGIERILVKDGHVAEIATKEKLEIKEEPTVNVQTKNSKASDLESTEFTVNGLYNYLKENIIGHDEALKAIATILFMNYKSTKEYGTESILIPGPTGTGKTATFNCAANYFNVPFKNINTCNLVPEGIEGTTLEDEFATLLDSCNGDIEKAEKSIIVFDEFDKLGVDSLDIKSSLVNVFLKALEGGNFPINRQLKKTRIFNTTMSSKIALGTFAEAYKRNNRVGYATELAQEEVFDKNLLVNRGYFSQELLTRFQHFITYSELSEEDKKRIILESKLSTYLKKKERLLKQFGIEIIGDEEFAEGVLTALKKDEKSVRDLNNIIATAFLDIEYEILSSNNKYKTLKLTKDTVLRKDYDLS